MPFRRSPVLLLYVNGQPVRGDSGALEKSVASEIVERASFQYWIKKTFRDLYAAIWTISILFAPGSLLNVHYVRSYVFAF